LPHLTSVRLHSLDLFLGLLQSNLKLFHEVVTYASSASTQVIITFILLLTQPFRIAFGIIICLLSGTKLGNAFYIINSIVIAVRIIDLALTFVIAIVIQVYQHLFCAQVKQLDVDFFLVLESMDEIQVA